MCETIRIHCVAINQSVGLVKVVTNDFKNCNAGQQLEMSYLGYSCQKMLY